MANLQIIERSEEPFRDRDEAARLLADHLRDFSATACLILGIPRGGVVIAGTIADELNCEMDIVLARKIGAPMNPELAIGSIAEDGKIFIQDDTAAMTGADDEYIRREAIVQNKLIQDRIESYRAVLPKAVVTGKDVIITDDGVATGATMKAAIWATRQHKPARIIAALPVGPEETLYELTKDADEVICLRTTSYFYAIGQFYISFDQVSDEEVMGILRRHHTASK